MEEIIWIKHRKIKIVKSLFNFISIYFILMEKIALSITNYYSQNSQEKDFIDEVEVKKICAVQKENSQEYSENLNFSNLDAEKIVFVLEKNENLKNNFFKYGVYASLEDATLIILLAKFKLPFTAVENFIDFLCGEENKPSESKIVNFI